MSKTNTKKTDGMIINSFKNLANNVDCDFSQSLSSVVEKSIKISPTMIVSSGIIQGNEKSTKSTFDYVGLSFTRQCAGDKTFTFSMSLNYIKKLIEALIIIRDANPHFA